MTRIHKLIDKLPCFPSLRFSWPELRLSAYNIAFLVAAIVAVVYAIGHLDNRVSKAHFNLFGELAQGLLSILSKFVVMVLGLGYLWLTFRNSIKRLYTDTASENVRIAIIVSVGIVAGFAILGFMVGGIY